ncbi:hypothetical protein AGDE_08999 [Angomonas deanei]|nr:hypothetical protein AGDE_08999 [Angomonas deanei]|eukprot:EPY31544.1 hypothetical protein AGDE_08999 [Angomonas deanei]
MGVGRAARQRGNMFNDDADRARAVDGQDIASRQQAQAVRNARKHFFAGIPRLNDVVDHSRMLERNYLETEIILASAPCSWLFCMALAISFVSKVPTPVEKILRTNHLGLHHISLPAVTLAEMYDCCNDYIHSRFHRHTSYNKNCGDDEFEDDEDAAHFLTEEEMLRLEHLHCEMATFDTNVIDPDEEDFCVGMGEHPPIPSLAQFRKELVDHASDPNSLYIFNFDPYVIEENEVRLKSNMAESEEEAAAILAAMRHTKETKGCFGILLDFNVVQRTVTFGVPHMTVQQYEQTEEGGEEVHANLERYSSVFANLILEEHTVSMQTLYDSLVQIDFFSKLSRGFVRVFISEDFAPKVESIFPLFVVDGSSAGGLMTNLLDVKIAPHILGLAMLHHLTITFLLTDSARRKQSSRNLLSKVNVCDVKLRGIPLTKIIQQLSLPLSVIVTGSEKSSVATAFVWYLFFLQQLQVQSDVRLGLVLPERRGGADDGQPNIYEEEFIDHLRIVVESKSVMLIGFNLNRALNVRISERKEPAHFAIVIGLDEERGIVRLADVNVKRFRKTWHIPLQRLYNATMGFGYMVASSDKKIIKSLNCKEFNDFALSQARFGLPPQVGVIQGRFEFPPGTYAVTVLADAVARLGYRSDVERFLNFSGFHYTYFLSKHMPLECATFVLQNYSHYALDDALTITPAHYCYHAGCLPAGEEDPYNNLVNPLHIIRTEEGFAEVINSALEDPENKILIVKYDWQIIRDVPAVWNGSYGGSYGIVVAYDKAAGLVTLSTGDAVPFYRVFACPLSLLFEAVCSWDPTDQRARGTILMEKKSQESNYINTKGFDMAHCLVHHPFKPIFSSTCSCLALATTEMMQNIQSPQLLGGAPLAVEDEDETKRYKRYNNIFSAEDFLYALPSFNVHDWEVKAQSEYSIVDMANMAFLALKLPLVAKDMLQEHPELLEDAAAFTEACRGVSGLLTITLIAYDTDKLHGLPGSSAGIVNRVATLDDEEDENDPQVFKGEGAGTVQLVEGDPARWGMLVERTIEELMAATTAIILIEEVMGDEEGEEQ